MQYLKISLIAMIGLVLYACSNEKPKAPAAQTAEVIDHIDSITVYCDEAFRYLISQEAAMYETDMPAQHLHIIYVPEAEALHVLMTDSFSTVVLGRRLRDSEKDELFKKSNLPPDERCFAKDAVAIVANKDFTKDTLTYAQVAGLIGNTSSEYKLVFEGNGSGILSYMFAQFGKGGKPSAFAAKNTEELIDYLHQDNKTIGFIPFVKISDEDDSASSYLLKKVKLLSVARADSTGKIHISTASQSEIADGSYPFSRPVNVVLHSLDDKVGTGFANFLYKERAGRIVLKSGLVPNIMPQRVINVTNEIK